jgi:anti-anti-sigma factor
MSEQLSEGGTAPGADPETLARYVEQLPAGMLAFHGPEHVVLAANGLARRWLGNRAGIVGRSIREMAPEMIGQALLETLDDVYKSGDPTSEHESRMLVAERGPDDLREAYLDFTLVPVPDRDGVVSGVLMHFSDVTETVLRRRAAEAKADELAQRYETTRSAVEALQRRLLPPGLPVLRGVGLGAHYLVAGAEQAAGGDWFDAIPLAGGRVALVVGDVVGHGAEASAVMGQLRAVLGEFLLDQPDVEFALARLDRFASRVPDARGATVCVGILDPADGSLRYACAGHLPPLVVGLDGHVRFLPAPGGGPIGVYGASARAAEATLEVGELLLSFTDGLVERDGDSPTNRLDELGRAASAAVVALRGSTDVTSSAALDTVSGSVVEQMTRQGYGDDVTLLVAQRTGRVVPDFAVELPARRGVLAGLREQLGVWLQDIGASSADVLAVQLAVDEAVTNSVKHAYATDDGQVWVEGVLDGGGRVCMTVHDNGTWAPPPLDPGFGGRGLIMMRGCMDSVEIDLTSPGTTLLLDLQLMKQFALSGTDGLPDSGPAARSLSVVAEQDGERRVTVGGPIDVDTVEELYHALRKASRGGALPFTLDLGGVTHLASVGIQLLYDLLEEMHTDGRELHIIAPEHSAARFALSVSGLDQMITLVDE